jgi:hypothetical protein
MRAVLMTAVGGPEVLELADLPEPEIAGEHDVRVRLRAAGINPVDYTLRSGGTIGGSLPAVLGWDGAGVVESIGPAVTRVLPGDEVYFCDGGFGPTPGTYQEIRRQPHRSPQRGERRCRQPASASSPSRRAWLPLPPGTSSGRDGRRRPHPRTADGSEREPIVSRPAWSSSNPAVSATLPNTTATNAAGASAWCSSAGRGSARRRIANRRGTHRELRPLRWSTARTALQSFVRWLAR